MIKQLILLMAVVPASCEMQDLQSTATPPAAEQEQVANDTTTARTLSSITCPNLIDTTPRGIACLHCMHPNSKEQRKVIAQIMKDTCLKNLATNFLVDGTFSFDPYAVVEFIDSLSTEGRQLFLTFYLTNGSTQRRWRTTKVNGFATGIAPEVFRDAIINNDKAQAAYQDIVKSMIPVIRYANTRGVKVQLVPALEDNLDDASFQKIADLTLEALPNELVVSLGRNPCPRCYLGNTGTVPSGYFREVHTANAINVINDGVVTNDGEDARLEELASVRDRAKNKNSQFILWNNKRQGLPNDLRTYPTVDDRVYAIPDDNEYNEIVDFLRAN